jgi:UDP-glucose 4-epimerase
MSKKRVLVTGGAGYIGSHIVSLLNKSGYSVVVMDNMSMGNEKNLFPENEFIQGDILNPTDLDKAFAQPVDAVFHFAAWKAAGESMIDPVKYSINNLNGTLLLLGKMVEKDCKKFIFSSSAAVYGSPQYLPIDENHPTIPENYYGYTKLAIEENLKWYEKLKGICFAALRYFNAAGYDLDGKVTGLEKTPNNLLPILMEVAAGIRPSLDIYGSDYETPDGTCIRDYIHVNDLATAHLLAYEYLGSEGKSLTVNLGSENGFSVQEMLTFSRKITGEPIPARVVSRRPGDPGKLLASSALAKSLLNWEAKVSDAESLIGSMWKIYKEIKNHS